MKRSYPERIARQTWIALVFVEVVGAAITLSAVADLLFGLGWGYEWKDVLAGFGIMAWVGLIWLACRAIFRVMGVTNPGS